MGLVKIFHRISGNSSNSRYVSYSPNVGGVGGDESNLSGDDSDDCELGEVGYELCMIEGQPCSVPYELYDLPDLKEILSLETWNLCLTEEERFSLSAYLPDMDQQTFWLTMMQLLGGKDMFFGSPLAELFKMLKGGFYPQIVSRFREGLQFLQRRVYYHSLRSYHERMVSTFLGMKSAWKQCQPSISAEERVLIWKAWKNNMESTDLIGLIAYHKDENQLNDKVTTTTIMHPLSKRTESRETKGHILPSPVPNGMKLVALNTSGKGVLKIKSSGTNSFQACIPKSVPSDVRTPCRPPPKGVLKIVPKGPTGSRQELPRAMLMQSELTETPGLQAPRLSHFPQHMYRWDAKDHHEESPFLTQKVDGGKAYRSAELPDCIMNQQRAEFMNRATRPSRCFQSSIRYVKRAKDPLFDGRTDFQEYNLFGSGPETRNKVETTPKGEGSSRNPLKIRRNTCAGDYFRQNLNQETGDHASKKSLEAYPFAAEYYRGERCMAPMQEKHIATYPKVTEASRILDIGIGEREMFTTHLDQVKRHKDVNIGETVKLHHRPEVLEGQQDGLVLPKTYKRRKALANLTH